MARKTLNSSHSLPSVTPPPLTGGSMSHNSQLRSSSRSNKKFPQAPKITKEEHTQQVTSSGDEASVNDNESEDDGSEANAEEGKERKPAVIAPSVRATIDDSEQAGLLTETGEAEAVPSTLDQSQETNAAIDSDDPLSKRGSHNSDDDDDYAAVNDISDSSEDEADIEKLAEKDIIEEAKAHPSSGLSRLYGLEDGILGEGETFFDHYPEADYPDSSVAAGDDMDYHSAWEGIPDTPAEMQVSMSGLLPSPSPRRVRFETPTSAHSLPKVSDVSDEKLGAGDMTKSPSQLSCADGLDEGGSGSGYETDDGETTDEEEPPVSACDLVKAPHLLRRPSLSSLDTSPTSYVFMPSPSEKPFKIPAAPASQRRKGPRLGTFKTSASRSYAMVNQTGNVLLIHHATRPSPSSTPRPSRVGSVASTSAPQTPVTSYATLALAPDLSETEFSDAAASQISADPILSTGPDFISSAGFSPTNSHTPQTAFPSGNQSSIWVPKDSFPLTTVLGGQANGIHVQYDDPAQEEMDESAFEDMIVFPEETSSEDEVSVVSTSSPTSSAFAIEAASTSAQTAPKTSPSSASSPPYIGLFNGVNVTAWRNSTNQRPQPRQPSTRLPHGLSLNGNALKGPRSISQPPSPPKKRKVSEIQGRKTPPAPTSKRRLTTSHR